MRNEGLYWVIRKENAKQLTWEVGHYDARFKVWSLIGTSIVYRDYEFFRVGKHIKNEYQDE